MSINKTYAVFGLGRYGFSVAKGLADSGADVIAVDANPDIVNEAMPFLPICKCADVTDEEVIRQLGIRNVDVAIIAMATSFEAAVMATALCKEAGVKTVIAKCGEEMHRKILLKVGADIAVFPEKESGSRLAKNLLSSGFADLMDLSDEASMVELDVREEWAGKTLIELNLRKKYSVNVVAIRKNSKICVDFDPAEPLEISTKLIVIANTTKLSKLR